MRNLKEVRRANFARLVAEMGGPREASIKLDMGESQVSQLISPNIAKAMGDRLAAKIEKNAKLDPGYLDRQTSHNGRLIVQVPIVDCPQFLRWARNGLPKNANSSQAHVVWDNSNPYTPKGRLLAMIAPDDSLQGIFSEGDLTIFDCWPACIKGPPAVKPSSVVAADVNGDLLVRILRELADNKFELFATSEMYAPRVIKDTRPILGVLVEVRNLKPIYVSQ